MLYEGSTDAPALKLWNDCQWSKNCRRHVVRSAEQFCLREQDVPNGLISFVGEERKAWLSRRVSQQGGYQAWLLITGESVVLHLHYMVILGFAGLDYLHGRKVGGGNANINIQARCRASPASTLSAAGSHSKSKNILRNLQ